jgi:pimeloyl-ACP methyl ester carboxylesterase
MTSLRMERLHQAVGRGWVQGMLSSPAAPQAFVLLLPPFFHEWQRSYRLFALLADALATRGIGVLRFDYRGTGESSDDDAAFLPSRALEDAEAMLALLRARSAAPVTLVGVRAGALLAERLAERHDLPWWAWQGVDSGRAHFDELRARDLHERNNRNRFPFLARHRASAPDALMGHRLHAEFAIELGIFNAKTEPAWRIDAAKRCGPRGFALPDEFAAWVTQIDLQGALPLAAVARLADAMATRLCGAREAAA